MTTQHWPQFLESPLILGIVWQFTSITSWRGRLTEIQWKQERLQVERYFAQQIKEAAYYEYGSQVGAGNVRKVQSCRKGNTIDHNQPATNI